MKTIVIVGAGFSGVACAIQLLRRATGGLHVILVNRTGPMGRGLAYGTACPDHLLNVPAGNMSVLVDDPGHFVSYCRRLDPTVTAATFVPRQVYGSYLAWALDQAEHAARPGVHLSRVAGEVLAVAPGPGPGNVRVHCRSGDCYEADRVLLALGHAPARDPVIADDAFFSSARYVRDPWHPDALDGLAGGERVLLLGTGLTGVDVANRLLRAAPGIHVTAMSRRGLVPQAHREMAVPPLAVDVSGIVDREPCVRAQFRALRRCIDEMSAKGRDWRDVIAALRPATAPWWRALPMRERGRFLRHVQPYWDSHRHRVAPSAHACFMAARASGQLQILAGRLLALEEHAGGVTVQYRARGMTQVQVMDVARVINCTGPEGNPARMADPLMLRLLADGLAQADPLGQGLLVAADGALIGARGRSPCSLYYLGPLLKARDWEATAVPELREMALGFARQALCRWGLDGGR